MSMKLRIEKTEKQSQELEKLFYTVNPFSGVMTWK